MSLANKPLNEITEADLQELIENKVAEGKEYDYKLKLWSGSDKEKKEFLADVSSFANTGGGHLIIGMDEAEGIPIAIVGLSDDLDAAKLRLENMLRDSIAPRIQGVDMIARPVQSGKVLIIRVPRSWSAPHMVTFDGGSKFYARNSAGKYQLDVNELRAAFTLSETTTERIRNFRLDRIAKISAGDTPIPLKEGAKLVLHVIPIGAFTSTGSLEFSSATQKRDHWSSNLRHHMVVNNHNYNLDGLAFYGASSTEILDNTYVQIFRNGTIEYADTYIFRGENQVIPYYLEQKILPILGEFFKIQSELETGSTVVIMLTLLGVRGFIIVPRNRILAFEYNARPVDRADLLIPDILVGDFSADLPQILRSMFDIVWNSCGYPRSLNYDEDGNWKPLD